MTSKNKNNPILPLRGFSVLELIATLIICSMVILAISQIIRHTRDLQERVNTYMTRQGEIQYCLDLLMSDILSAAQQKSKIEVAHASYGLLETSHLIITSEDMEETASDPLTRIDWVAVPRYEKEDLILFRREKKAAAEDEALYIPLCENLCTFRLYLLNDDETDYDDPNTDPAMIQIQAQLYRDDESGPEDVITVNRSYCLKRFKLPDIE
ncbi:MAG: hypothetical protein JW860_10685 [Sedimentisphaerales bacterium]|nr:hypothetical protein [Sedimentisphaerales bacterium]